MQKWRSDFLWVRPLDVPVALAARTYLAEGSVVLDVVDGHGFGAGRYRLEGGPDGATCKPTTKTAGVTVTAEALGAAYLGNVTLGTLARAGQVSAADDGALATADAMFRGAVPAWCTTWF
jgi:predicted acetyltransferase